MREVRLNAQGIYTSLPALRVLDSEMLNRLESLLFRRQAFLSNFSKSLRADLPLGFSLNT